MTQNVAHNTRFYGDKILYKNLDLTQDSPNKILFHFIWEQNFLQNLPKIFRWPEMCSLGKILAQDFQMAAVTKILMRRDQPIAPLLSLGDISRKHLKNKHKHKHGDCDAVIVKASGVVTHIQSLSQEVGSGDEGLGLFGFDLSSAETDFWWLGEEQRRRNRNQYMASIWGLGFRRSWRI